MTLMERLRTHLRTKFLAGALAAGPIVILIVVAVWLEQHTRPVTELLGFHFPGFGILLALVAVYLLGLVVTSVLGKVGLRLADKAIRRVPGLSLLYQAWKDILVIAPDKAGIFHQVVLVPDPEGRGGAQIGFTSGQCLPGDAQTCCVFLPGVPNPISGRLILVHRDACLPLGVATEEAFKFLLSTGNYLPEGLQGLPPRPTPLSAPERGAGGERSENRPEEKA